MAVLPSAGTAIVVGFSLRAAVLGSTPAGVKRLE
jgi:hypothetical protein